MPAPVKATKNTTKHYTPSERLARQNAEQEMQRQKVKLRIPRNVKDDPISAAYWKQTVHMMRNITLLDDLDSDMLGAYCVISARWERLSALATKGIVNGECDEKLIPRVEAAERNRLAYAEKLGLTPSGRVRLAKRRAEGKPVDPDIDLYGD